jgi:hypothetical protein
LNHAWAVYKAFLEVQEDISENDDIISAWHDADEDGTLSKIETEYPHLEVAADEPGLSVRLSNLLRQVSNMMEADYIRFQARYINAVKAWAQESADAFLVRIQELQAVDEIFDRAVAHVHKKEVERLMESIANLILQCVGGPQRRGK